MSMIPGRGDRNLLFGVIALQMDLVGRDALIASMNDWALAKHRPLGELLVERGVLEPDHRDAIERMLDCQLARHGGDAGESLAALTATGVVASEVLRLLDDPGATALATTSPYDDPDSTRAYSPSVASPPDVRYRKLRDHARGGLGVVSVARDLELNREVALKEIQGPLADDPASRARFLLEAEITGRLEHPGIVPIYGLGSYPDGRPYYAMRFIKGESLRRAIAIFHEDRGEARDPGSRTLGMRHLLKCFLDACNAISYAHSRGVLHRDLKPDNILLGSYGETLVVDWVLAKAVGRPDAEGHPEETLRPASGGSGETLPGSALGTPAYMSPEQAAGQIDRLGPASDVYGLGATLYSLLTGKAPFVDVDVASIRRRVILGDFPPPRQVRPDVAPALESICLKAMALEPADRYGSPLALAGEVEHWLADEPVEAHPEGTVNRLTRWVRHHRAWAWSGAAASAVVALALIASTLLAGQYRIRELRNLKDLELANAEVRRSAERGARLDWARGQSLCEEGQIERGVAWIARALVLAPVNQDDLRWEIATTLDARRTQVHRLRFGLERRAKLAPAAFSADGRLALTGGQGGGQLWEAATGRPVGPAIAPGARILSVALSPDGRLALTGGSDGLLRFHDVVDGSEVGPALDHGSGIMTILFAPDGKTVATGSYGPGQGGKGDGWTRVWDVAGRRPIAGPLPQEGWVLSMAFAPDGRTILTTGTNGTAWLWDAADGRRKAGLPHVDRGAYYVRDGEFSPDGRTILTASADGTARLWDAGDGRPIGEPLIHLDAVFLASFSPDGVTFATGCGDGTVWLWKTDTRSRIGEPTRHEDVVDGTLAFSADGRALLSASRDGTVRLWDPATGRRLGGAMSHPGRVTSAALDCTGRSILTTCDDGVARLWEVSASRSLEPVLDHGKWLRTVAFSPDGRTILTAGIDGLVRFWEGSKPLPTMPTLKHEGEILAAAFSPDGKAVATAGQDSRVVLWDVRDGHPIRTFAHPAGVAGLAFGPDGRTLLTACEDGVARLWDVATGATLGPSQHSDGGVLAVAFSPDGRTLATAWAKGRVALWDAADGRPLGQLAHPAPVKALAFRPDGRTLLTGCLDGLARTWDVAGAAPLGLALRHSAGVLVVAFSPDGRTLATGGQDRRAHLWDVATGRRIGPVLQHQLGFVTAIAFSPDGRSIVTGAADRTAKLWDVPHPVSEDARRATLWGEVFTNLRLHGDEFRPLDYETWRARARELAELEAAR